MPRADRPTLAPRLRTVPLLGALVPMMAGIALGSLVDIPLYLWMVCAVVCALVAWAAAAYRRRAVCLLYIALAIVFTGAALARAHTPVAVIPREERVWMEMRITDTPVWRGSASAHTSGHVGRWQPASDPAPAPRAEGWSRAGEKLLVSLDTMYRLEAGDRVVFRGYVNPVADSGSYARLMLSRGYTGRTYISRWSRPAVSPGEHRGLGTIAAKLQSAASERLNRLELAPDERALAAAMTTGDRSGITPELRRAYSRTGTSHLLAISGLHVGIVFLIVNSLLWLLPLVRGGHIIRNVVAVAAIWLYAVLSGLSPSATRAAFMFTGAQAALATSQSRSPVNIMCGTALVMLALRPGLLFDVSFQLSFIAVTAIMAWFPPLYRLVRSGSKPLNALWATLIVGFAASVGTMPLVSHTFGVFSPLGVVLNPLVIATAYLVVGFSLVWIIVPVPFLEPAFRWLAGGPAWVQNRTIEAAADVGAVAVEYTLPLWAMAGVYAAMIIFTAWGWAVKARKEI